MLNSVLSFLLAIGILVFLHELGHYSVARLCGVRVVQFSVGFGRPVLKWMNRKTGVLWTLGWLPLGGFVRMLDERDPESVEQAPGELNRAFNRQSVGKRIAIVLAGPVANLLVAWVLYTVLSLGQTVQLTPRLGAPLPGTAAEASLVQAGDRVVAVDGDRVDSWSDFNWAVLDARLFDEPLLIQVERDAKVLELPPIDIKGLGLDISPTLSTELGFELEAKGLIVGSIQPGSAGETMGLQSGDLIVELNGAPVASAQSFTQTIRESIGTRVELLVDRNGSQLRLDGLPDQIELETGGTAGRLGIGIALKVDTFDREPEMLQALAEGGQKMLQVSWFSLAAMGKMLTGDMSWKHLSGPVSIASAAGQSSSLGILPFLSFLAMVSVSLGILNLLPIPVLDGGHLMYYFAEILRGKPVSEASMLIGQKIGLMLIGLLTFVALFNDLQRLL